MVDPFTSVELSAKAAQQIKCTNYRAGEMLQVLRRLPDSREKSIAIERLEECVMWANKAAAHSI